jgi:hypothetical protein
MILYRKVRRHRVQSVGSIYSLWVLRTTELVKCFLDIYIDHCFSASGSRAACPQIMFTILTRLIYISVRKNLLFDNEKNLSSFRVLPARKVVCIEH